LSFLNSLTGRIYSKIRVTWSTGRFLSIIIGIQHSLLNFRLKHLSINWNIREKIYKVINIIYFPAGKISQVLRMGWDVGLTSIESILNVGYGIIEVVIVAIYKLQALSTTMRLKLATLKYKIKKYIKRREM